ncbi:MAG: AAA family ATPase [Gammaproteobacteria bacterium]|nr:AAA family ATPase [Gammaproteobacteria bacterium]
MYETYYGFTEKPFSLTPDTDFFFQSYTHQEALNVLLVAIKSGDGFVKLTGEVGTGKTLLCRKLLDSLDHNYNTVYIPNPYMSCNALLDAVIAEMGIAEKLEKDNYLACINSYLIDSARQSKATVIILDEAQSLPEESLEAIRLLSNLETEKKKLVQIVLFGQPELDHKLSHSSIRQLQQRIMHAYHLKPLSKKVIRDYLQHRVKSAGYVGPELFDRSARQLLFKISQGVPRIINVLSNKAMMQAYASGEFYISKKHIQAAAKDGNVSQYKTGRQGLQAAMLATFTVSICLLGLQL